MHTDKYSWLSPSVPRVLLEHAGGGGVGRMPHSTVIRHTSGISGGFRQLRIYDSAVMANFGTFVMRPKEDTVRDKLIPRKLVRQSRGDTKDEDVICHHSAHCRQILSIKTPLSSPSNSRII